MRSTGAQRRTRALAALTAVWLLAGCGREQSMLTPHGMRAERIDELGRLMFWIGAAVWLLVVILLALSIRPRPPVLQDPVEPPRLQNTMIVLAGLVMPAVLLLAVTGSSIGAMRDLNWPESSADRVVRVIAHQWWWEIRYPGTDAVTANEVHIPTGERVLVKLTTADVIHSFWVPALGEKVDLVPGKVNHLWLHTDRPGTYRGACAEFCGLEHAKMRFRVVAERPSAFRGWLDNMRAPAPPATTEPQRRGLRVLLTAGCAECHTVRGTPADGDVGPDLTHLMSRETLAAGTLPNRKGHLAGWVLDPQEAKRGAKMPPTSLTPAQSHSLIAYLRSLR